MSKLDDQMTTLMNSAFINNDQYVCVDCKTISQGIKNKILGIFGCDMWLEHEDFFGEIAKVEKNSGIFKLDK